MIYEYACSVCGSTFELEQSIKDAPLTECVKCNALGVKRLVSGGTFVLRGDGWARDSYSSKQHTNKDQ